MQTSVFFLFEQSRLAEKGTVQYLETDLRTSQWETILRGLLNIFMGCDDVRLKNVKFYSKAGLCDVEKVLHYSFFSVRRVFENAFGTLVEEKRVI